jgi:hypothetical protein
VGRPLQGWNLRPGVKRTAQEPQYNPETPCLLQIWKMNRGRNVINRERRAQGGGGVQGRSAGQRWWGFDFLVHTIFFT